MTRMRVLFLEGGSSANYSTRWRTYAVGRWLEARGHEVTYYHLLLTPDEAPFINRLPVFLQQMILRLLCEVRALCARRLCRSADKVIVRNVYTSRWLIRFLRRRCGGYVYDTVDFADTADFVRLHCRPGWRGALKRWRMLLNQRAFLAYVAGADLVCTNNSLCVELCRKRGKRAYLFIDPIPEDMLVPVDYSEKFGPFVMGWTGTAATSCYMSEYLDVFAEFTAAGKVRMEMMEGDENAARQAGAVVVPWTIEGFRDRLPRWSVGIAPLPSHVPFAGKFPGKILQYMAAGIPSIVTPKGMATYFIEEGRTGLYAETGEDWRDTIAFLLEHPEEAERMGRNARKDFEQRFSLEAQMDEYERTVLSA